MITLIVVLAVLTVIGFSVSAISARRDLKRLIVVSDEVNEAVNHKEMGMPTLVARVISQDERGVALAEELLAFRKWTTTVLKSIAEFHGLPVPAEPETVAPTNVLLPPK